MKDDDAILARLTALEEAVAALKVNAGLVEPAARDLAPVKYVEPKVTIAHLTERCPITLPTETEYRRILSAVRDAYPQCRSSNCRFADEDEAFREFCATFERVSHLRRTEKVDTKHALAWWVDETNQWLQGSRQIDGASFLAAVIGSGDVSFVQRDEYGNVWSFALATFGGRAASEAGWRRVLGGQLLRPVPGRFGGPGPGPSVRLEAEQ